MAHSNDYSQLVIGACGHVCHAWPQVCDLGGQNPTYICETCTREQHGVDIGEGFTVWVPPKKAAKPVAAKPKAEPKPKKAKPLSQYEQLLQQAGLW